MKILADEVQRVINFTSGRPAVLLSSERSTATNVKQRVAGCIWKSCG